MDMASSPTSNTHFDSALDYLDRFHRRHFAIEYLKTEVRILKTFAICARSWRWSKVLYSGGDEKGDCERLGCTLSRIQHLVSSIPNRIHSAFRTPGRDIAEICVTTFQEEIEHLGTEIKDFYTIFVEDQNHNSQGDPDPDPDPRRLTDLIDSLLDVLLDEWLYKLKVYKGDLMFLKNFISFATMQLQGGIVGRMQLIDLLLHVEFLALNAARLIHILWLGIFDEQVREKMESEISRLLHKIKPADADPSVRQTYIRVLADSKLTRSSHTFTLEKNSHIVVAIFIDSFVGYLMELLNSCTSFVVSVRNQLKKLYQSVTFLKILSGEWQEKFNGLDDEMKDHIGVAVCDAGILIFSLSVNEMKAGLAKETDMAHFHLLKKVQFIVAKIYATKSSFSFPMTNEQGSLDFLLENFKELAKCEADSIAVSKDQINTIQEDLSSLKSFLEKIVEQRNNNEKLQALWGRVMEVAYKAEFVIDSLQALQVGDKTDCSPLSLDTITEEIKFIKIEADEIYDSMRHEGQAQQVTKTFIHMPSQVCTPSLNEVQVGLTDEVQRIVGGLTRGSKRLDIVSIVGMPGLGKTTLANKIYNDPVIMCHFHIRAWCIVSQVYSRHKLLLEILADFDSESSNQFLKTEEDDLAEKVYKHLKGKRYLIVLDDMWDIEAWNLMERSFPDDANASRILFTSRFHNLSSQFKLDCSPYHLRPLTHEESWELLQSKLFGKEGCPPTLRAVAMQISEGCKGLPLTIVVVAGILASTEQDCWEEVAQSLSSNTVIETEHCMKTLELSYRHLPDHLKSCLLYFGAFQEDQNIPVQRLLRLWISEGFVQKTELAKSLEDAADEYLMNLVGRSLVMITQERSLSGAKACRIHDLLREFCILKAKEESFLHCFHGYHEHFTSHRLCISSEEKLEKSRLFFPYLRSLLFYSGGSYSRVWHDYLFIFRISKLLRVLDIRELTLYEFPWEIELLVHLRYLAIKSMFDSIPSGIANLSRLETFLIAASSNVELPNTIWGMKKLRHLCARSIYGGFPVGFVLPMDDLDRSLDIDLCGLDTFTLAIDPSSQSMQRIMRKLPSIRRLKCVEIKSRKLTSIRRLEIKSRKSTGNCNENLDLRFLSRLEYLRVARFGGIEFDFPLNLKKLTLSDNGHPWSKISTIGMLPKLQVLKLLSDAFVGDTWEIKEGEFPQLRVLKLESLDIVRWTASCDNFPPLQKLILTFCFDLEEVPSCLGEIPTIRRIEVINCPRSVVRLVKEIQKEQMDYGNDLEIVE